MYKVFIDGAEGTTGLRIFDRFKDRTDIEILKIDPELRKDEVERAKLINSSDITFLCLPDAAAIDAVGLVTNENTVIIDTSTAHRTAPGWTYGFPELSAVLRNEITVSKRIANPGCHATGFVSLVYPLIQSAGLKKDQLYSCFSLTGYSGGGKKMIAQYEDSSRNTFFDSPRQYGLNQTHKHLKEMKAICQLETEPFFSPIVADFYSGMETSVFLEKNMFKDFDFSMDNIYKVLSKHYEGSKLISVHEPMEATLDQGFIPANLLSGKDTLEIFINGNSDRVVISSLFDNLGKGASGAAIQNMNIRLGFNETAGLTL